MPDTLPIDVAQPQTNRDIKVAIIEDRREIREGLATLIQFTAGYACVGRFYGRSTHLQNRLAGICPKNER